MSELGWGLRKYKDKSKHSRHDDNPGLNENERRECVWNTSFPAEYQTVTSSNGYRNTLAFQQDKMKRKKDKRMMSVSRSKRPYSSSAGSSFDAISSAFKFEYHEGSDPKQEIQVMKCILMREGFLTQLQSVSSDIDKALEHENGAHVLNLLLETREAGIQVVEAIQEWRKAFNVPRAFMYGGVSYLKKMMDDLNFLAKIQPLAQALGVPASKMKNNPFMRSSSLAHEPRDESDQRVYEAERMLLQSAEYEVVEERQEVKPAEESVDHTDVLDWKRKAEHQLELLSMPMESMNRIHLMDSSNIMKRKGQMPLVPLSPPKTLNDLVRTVRKEKKHATSSVYAKLPKKKYHVPSVSMSAETAKYLHVKSRVTAKPKHPLRRNNPKNQVIRRVKGLPGYKKRTIKKKAKKKEELRFNLGGTEIAESDLIELSEIIYPAQVVPLVAATVLILISPGEYVPKDVSWAAVRQLLATGREFLTTLEQFNSESIPVFKIRALEPFLKNEQFRPKNLIDISPPTAALCGWVLATVSKLEECRPWLSDCLPIEYQPIERLDKKPQVPELDHPPVVEAAEDERMDLLSFLHENDRPEKPKPEPLKAKKVIEKPKPVVLSTEGRKLLCSNKYQIAGQLFYLSLHTLKPGEATLGVFLSAYCPETANALTKIVSEKVLNKYSGARAIKALKLKEWTFLLRLISQILDLRTSDHQLCYKMAGRSLSPVRLRTTEPSAPIKVQEKEEVAVSEEEYEDDGFEEEAHQPSAGKDDYATYDLDDFEMEEAWDQKETSFSPQRPHNEKNQETKSAIKIQSIARQRKARQRVDEMKLKKEESVKIREQKKESAVKIQSIARQRKARQRVDEMKQKKESAVKIQALARQRKAKQRVDEMKQKREHHQLKREHSVVRIQSLARQRQAKRRVDSVREQKASVVRIQSIARKRQATKRVDTIREHQASAVKIQSIARKRHANKRVENIRKQQQQQRVIASPADSVSSYQSDGFEEEPAGDDSAPATSARSDISHKSQLRTPGSTASYQSEAFEPDDSALEPAEDSPPGSAMSYQSEAFEPDAQVPVTSARSTVSLRSEAFEPTSAREERTPGSAMSYQSEAFEPDTDGAQVPVTSARSTVSSRSEREEGTPGSAMSYQSEAFEPDDPATPAVPETDDSPREETSIELDEPQSDEDDYYGDSDFESSRPETATKTSPDDEEENLAYSDDDFE